MNTHDFIKEIKKRLQNVPEDSRIGVLLEFAQFIPYGERYAVLKILEQYDNGSVVLPVEKIDLLDTTKKLCERIEAGAYKLSWDVEYYYDHYEDEEFILLDHNGIGEAVEHCLAIIMDGVEKEKCEEAFQAFELLFDIALIPEGEDEDCEYYEDENGEIYYAREGISLHTLFNHSMIHLDEKKVMSYYARSAIVTLEGERRVEKIFDILYPSYYDMSMSDILRPSSGGDLPLRNFLDEWIDFLMNVASGKSKIIISHYFISYIEQMIVDTVVFMGDDALKDFVAQHGETYQSSFVKLINSYISTRQYELASDVASDALDRISGIGKIRTEISDLLVELSSETHDKDMMRKGVLEGFLSCGDLNHFLAVLRLGDDDIFNTAITFIHMNKRDDRDWYCIRFLVNDYFSVWNEVNVDKESLGWSYSEKGKTFPLFIALLTAGNAGHTASDCLCALIGSMTGKKISNNYLEAFQRTVIATGDEIDTIASWCIAETISRVDAIVGGQHRGSYDKTALLLVSLAEALWVRKGSSAAKDLIEQVKNKYPRHRAFHASLREYIDISVMSESP